MIVAPLWMTDGSDADGSPIATTGRTADVPAADGSWRVMIDHPAQATDAS
jgi:hypothetical protein